MTNENENDETNTPVKADEITDQFLLSDGRKFIIRKLKGRDAIEAQKVIGEKSEMFLTASIAQACEIDGQTYPPEYYADDVSYEDYIKIMGEFSKANFSLAQGK